MIRLKLQNICMLVGGFLTLLGTYKLLSLVPFDLVYEQIFGEDPDGPCNKRISFLQGKASARRPTIGILGPPGSGVQWLRYLIEQMTGVYTGSVHKEKTFPTFPGDGKTKKVVAIMTHDVDKLPQLSAAIILFRGMEDSVRTQFAEMQGPGAFLEAPLQAYYGNEWNHFAVSEANMWTDRYQLYVDSSVPLLVLSYDQLIDPNQIKSQLLRMSNFLHMPVKHSTIECLVERASDAPHHPRPLRFGFQPFQLLPAEEREHLLKLENYTEALIQKTRDNFSPKMHVNGR